MEERDNLRKYSTKSQEAILSLLELKQSIQSMENQISEIEKSQVPQDKKAKMVNDLRQLSGSLDRLQYSGVDGVITAELNSGKTNAKELRRSLNQRCEDLRDRILSLHNSFT